MNYIAARHLIQDGDTIAVRRRTGIFPRLISSITKSPYTHVGIAVWTQDRLLLAQMTGSGNNLIPVSQLTEFDVYRRPKTKDDVTEAIWQLFGQHISYAFVDLLKSAANELLSWRFPATRHAKICSTLNYTVYKLCGWHIVIDGIPTPRDICANLKLVLTVSEA